MNCRTNKLCVFLCCRGARSLFCIFCVIKKLTIKVSINVFWKSSFFLMNWRTKECVIVHRGLNLISSRLTRRFSRFGFLPLFKLEALPADFDSQMRLQIYASNVYFSGLWLLRRYSRQKWQKWRSQTPNWPFQSFAIYIKRNNIFLLSANLDSLLKNLTKNESTDTKKTTQFLWKIDFRNFLEKMISFDLESTSCFSALFVRFWSVGLIEVLLKTHFPCDHLGIPPGLWIPIRQGRCTARCCEVLGSSWPISPCGLEK